MVCRTRDRGRSSDVGVAAEGTTKGAARPRLRLSGGPVAQAAIEETMEETWERRYPAVRLSPARIAELLEPALPGARVERAERVPGGTLNTTYQVRVAGRAEPLALRVYQMNPEACRREWSLFRLVRERVPTPEVLYASPRPAAEGWTYSLQAWVEGQSLDTLLKGLSPEDLLQAAHAAGATLARIAAFQFSRSGFFGPTLAVEHPFRDLVGDYLDHLETTLFRERAGAHLGEALARRIWGFVSERRSCLEPLREERSLVHGDYRGANLLMRKRNGGWEVAAVVDWEWAHAGSALEDLGTLLRDEAALPPGFEGAFTRGFVEQGGRLPEGWRVAARLLALVGLCDCANGPHPRPAVVRDARRIACAMLDATD